MKIKLLNRQSLKVLFTAGARPKESNFFSLIDSMVNKVDDGISKTEEDGLILSPEGKESNRVMSFYQNVEDDIPQWSIDLNQQDDKSLSIIAPITEKEHNNVIAFQKTGEVGIGTRKPKTTLEVNGTLGTNTRVGTYKIATVPADGQWHDILTNLDGCVAFEIMAQVGKEKSGRYALLHAHAVSTFGKSHHKIRKTQAHYGWFWNKIAIRFTGSTYNYKLQLKTKSNYGDDVDIKYHITKLWDTQMNELFK
ncbi:adhesin [Tenacibaculum jejuense]|uniref:Phage protein n=1 Tax=Tenacibaculum jejuense TaxID=584609 RepID=A0A238U644_9FLAO|nr:adhesin [Tenacibaculum jejuense]SNR14673.1 phage protein [Tenacibaculum jejuense]